MSFNFDEALDVKAGDVEKPPVQPQGNYIWAVSKMPTQTTSKNGEWAIIEFPVKAVEAMDDVDPDDLEAFGDVSSAMNRVTFMAPTDPTKTIEVEKMIYRLKRFLLETLRVDGDEDTTMRELIANSVNCQFIATASWRMVEEDTYVDVKNMAPLD